MSSNSRAPSRQGTRQGGSSHPKPTLLCNHSQCRKPLATTCFLCACDCIFCEGTNVCCHHGSLETHRRAPIEWLPWHSFHIQRHDTRLNSLVPFSTHIIIFYRLHILPLWEELELSCMWSRPQWKWFYRACRCRFNLDWWNGKDQFASALYEKDFVVLFAIFRPML